MQELRFLLGGFLGNWNRWRRLPDELYLSRIGTTDSESDFSRDLGRRHPAPDGGGEKNIGKADGHRQPERVGPWTIATTYKADKFDNCTMSSSAENLGISFVRNQDGLLLLLDSSKWKLERGKPLPFVSVQVCNRLARKPRLKRKV